MIMKLIAVLLSLTLAVEQSTAQPVDGGECNSEESEKMLNCIANTYSSPEAEQWRAEVQKEIAKCFPGFGSPDCQAKGKAADKCFKDLELEIGSDKSLSMDQKSGALFALDLCVPIGAWQTGIDAVNPVIGSNHTDNDPTYEATMTMSTYFSEIVVMNGENDTCVPNKDQLDCIIKGVKESPQVQDYDAKVADISKKCKDSAPKACSSANNVFGGDKCDTDLKSYVTKYQARVKQCPKK